MRLSIIDYVYIFTLIWGIVRPFVIDTLKSVLFTIFSRFIKSSEYIHSASDLSMMLRHSIVVKYGEFLPPFQVISLLKGKNNYAVIYVKSTKGSDFNDPMKEIGNRRFILFYINEDILEDLAITIKIKKIDENQFVRMFNLSFTPPSSFDTNSESIRVQKPGNGCHPEAWRQLKSILESVKEFSEREIDEFPLGAAILLVGKPGSGKSTLAKHISRECSKINPRVLQIPANAIYESENTYTNLDRVTSAVTTEYSVVLSDDIDRYLDHGDKAKRLRLLHFIDKAIMRRILLIFTANSIELFNPAELSRLHVVYVDQPDNKLLPKYISEIMNINIDVANEWVSKVNPDDIRDLRQLRNVIMTMRPGESLPDCIKRVNKLRDDSINKAKEDGTDYL